MVEAIANFFIWIVRTIFSDSFWTFLSIIAIIVAINLIITTLINRGKDSDERKKDIIYILGAVATILIAALILSITLR